MCLDSIVITVFRHKEIKYTHTHFLLLIQCVAHLFLNLCPFTFIFIMYFYEFEI